MILKLSDLVALEAKLLGLDKAVVDTTSQIVELEDKIVEAYRTAPGVSDPVDSDDPRYLDILWEMREVVEAKDLHAATNVLIEAEYGDFEECRDIARHVRRRIRK